MSGHHQAIITCIGFNMREEVIRVFLPGKTTPAYSRSLPYLSATLIAQNSKRFLNQFSLEIPLKRVISDNYVLKEGDWGWVYEKEIDGKIQTVFSIDFPES